MKYIIVVLIYCYQRVRLDVSLSLTHFKVNLMNLNFEIKDDAFFRISLG